MSPIDVVYVHIPVTAKLADGTAATVAGIDVAVVPKRSGISAATVWMASSYASDTATVLLAGPDATPPTDALVIPAGGADLWIRDTDNPEVTAVKVGSVSVS
jgi:hypothetical protein